MAYKTRGATHWSIFEINEWAWGQNERITANVMTLPIQFDSRENWSIELKRRFKSLYRYPVNGVIYMAIGNLRKEGVESDKKVGALSLEN